MVATANRMVGDIGGTNTRLALFDAHAKQLRFQRNYRNRDYSSLADISLPGCTTSVANPRKKRALQWQRRPSMTRYNY